MVFHESLYFVSDLFLLVIGLFTLVYGSDKLVPQLEKLASGFNVSRIVIGLTIVSIGTSLPEIATAIVGAYTGAHDVVLGNIIGSHIAQITLLLGLVAFAKSEGLNAGNFKRLDLGMVVFAAFYLLFITLDSTVTFYEGLVGVLIYVLYVGYRFRNGDHKKIKTKAVKAASGLPRALIMSGLFLVMILFGSFLTVGSAVNLASGIGVSSYIIGLIIVGLGTSLPELSVSMSALRKNSNEIAFGNLVGSNITDPLFSLGLGALVSDLTTNQSLLFDAVFFVLVTLFVAILVFRDNKVSRVEGAVLIALYSLFVLVKLAFFAF